MRTVIRAGNVLNKAFQHSLRLAESLIKRIGIGFQLVLQLFEIIRLKDIAEYLLPFGRIGKQQLAEIPLSYHGYLRKLLIIDAQNLPRRFRDGGRSGYDTAIRANQLGIRFLRNHFRSVSGGTFIFGIAANSVFLFAV